MSVGSVRTKGVLGGETGMVHNMKTTATTATATTTTATTTTTTTTAQGRESAASGRGTL